MCELDNLARALLHARGPMLTADLLDAPVTAPPDAAPPDAFRDPSGRFTPLMNWRRCRSPTPCMKRAATRVVAPVPSSASRPALERKLDRYGLRPRARTED